jgi:hypothetical protein
MDRADGSVTELAKSFSYAVGVKNGFVYGVACDGKDADRLVRVDVKGGEVETVVDIPCLGAVEQGVPTFKCDYRSILVDDEAAYVSHWNSRPCNGAARGSDSEYREKSVLDAFT